MKTKKIRDERIVAETNRIYKKGLGRGGLQLGAAPIKKPA